MKKLVPVAAALCLLATASAGQVVGTADSIAEALTDYGLKVERETDAEGAPKLLTRIEGTRFTIWFYDCDDGPCTSLQFSAGFDLNDPLSASKMNEWNRDKRFGKAWIDDEGDPFLEMNVALGAEGVSANSFDLSLDMWRIAMGQFRNFIDW